MQFLAFELGFKLHRSGRTFKRPASIGPRLKGQDN